MLFPIYCLLFNAKYLSLPHQQVSIFYKTYRSDDQAEMQAIIDQKLAPGKTSGKFCQKNLLSVASVAFGHPGEKVEHAMVLDTYDKTRDVLIFKNTHNVNGQPKKLEIMRTDLNAPNELYFVHIEVLNMENLPPQSERCIDSSDDSDL